MDISTPLLSQRPVGAAPRRRSGMDHAILIVVILLALVALRYLHGVSGPTTWGE